MNDAPGFTLTDAEIAMGGLGSDATNETADILFENEQSIKIFTAVNIGKKQNKLFIKILIWHFIVKVIFF